MKRVLILTHDFPPRGGAGVFRITKFARYLPEWGWQPVVVTVADPGPRPDPDLLKQLPYGMEIIRVPVPGRRMTVPQAQQSLAEPSGWRARLRPWIVPDPQVVWVPFAVQAVRRRLAHKDIAVLLTTAPPFSVNLSAWFLKRWYPRLPWLMDMRDIWTDGPWQHSPLLYKINRVLEQRCLEACDHCTVVTEGVRQLMLRTFGVDPQRLTTLTNGYDPTDVPSMLLERELLGQLGSDAKPLIIRYVGTMGGLRAQAAEGLFQALGQMVAAGLNATQLRLELVGAFGPAVHAWAAPFVAAGMVNIVPPVAHARALESMATADVLLLVLTDDWEGRIVHTSKLFEYLSVGRPILAIAPPGEVTTLLRAEKAGISAAPFDVTGIVGAIQLLLDQHVRGELTAGQANRDRFRHFQRRELTRQLAHQLDLLTEK